MDGVATIPCLIAVGPIGAATAVGAAGPFDGVWKVELICATAPDGAAGFSYSFDARVAAGVMLGESGVRGLTGFPAYTMARCNPARPTPIG
ncbi:MAG TPA: hypothetical protein VFA03_08265 [Acetobacteraceae bacterium]|nr:hypothetical protein [Acetobacteraceae bacterium]